MSGSSELENRVRGFIQKRILFSRGQKLLVAVSGGPDSVCLLYVLSNLCSILDIRLHIAHLNHQLRGAEADADADYVSVLAARLGIPVTIEKYDVRSYRDRNRISLEEAARDVRYDFLARAARAIGVETVAIGHTLDDNVETILLHLIRGSGVAGMVGLQPVRLWQLPEQSLRITRPLLEVSREETLRYCEENRLSPRQDASNLSLSLLRNKARLQLIPMLKNYNPGIVQALIRTSKIASDELSFLDEEAGKAWDSAIHQQDRSIAIDKISFLPLHPALKRHLLRKCIEKFSGSIKDIEARHIEEMIALLDKPAGKRLNLPQGLIFYNGYDSYQLAADFPALSCFPALSGKHPVTIPGDTLLPGWEVEAAILGRADIASKDIEGGGFTAFLDLDKGGREIYIRSRLPGDRFQPMGMNEAKKLNRFMIDEKIPRPWRQHIPIMVSGDNIIWVVGWRIDERFKVTGSTGRVLRLEMRRRYEESGGGGKDSRKTEARTVPSSDQ